MILAIVLSYCYFEIVLASSTPDDRAMSLLEAVAAAREADLVHFESHISFNGRLIDKERSKFADSLPVGEFVSVVKRDPTREWLGGYSDGKLLSAFTVADGRGFYFAAYKPGHFGSIHYRGNPDSPVWFLRNVDPRTFGLRNDTGRQKNDAVRKLWRLDEYGTERFTFGMDRNVGHNDVKTVQIDVLAGLIMEIDVDARLLRVLESRFIHSKFDEPVVCVTTCHYSDHISISTLPAKVECREWVGDAMVYESTAEVKVFKLKPNFSETDFGIVSVGMPTGTVYFDQALEKNAIWSGDRPISPQLAVIPPISKDLIAKKNAEEAAKNRWLRTWLLYGIGSTGILIVTIILYRHWRRPKA